MILMQSPRINISALTSKRQCLRHHSNITTRLVKIQTLTPLNADKVVEQKELSSITGRMVQQMVLWKAMLNFLESLTYSCHMIQKSILFPSISLSDLKNLCPQKNLHMNIYRSFIHKCCKLKQPRGSSINKRNGHIYIIEIIQ